MAKTVRVKAHTRKAPKKSKRKPAKKNPVKPPAKLIAAAQTVRNKKAAYTRAERAYRENRNAQTLATKRRMDTNLAKAERELFVLRQRAAMPWSGASTSELTAWTRQPTLL